MALVEGESVGDRVRRAGALPIVEARRILREVADALAYAHARGVVHRDIKPDNILLDAQNGRAMVTDFGIARAASEGESRLTATGAAIGTPAYMSPEQCAGDRDLDGRSDLYSLGAVAYQMLTGEPPFSGGSTPAIMVKHVTERPAPPSQRRADVPTDLDAIVMRLLEKEPARRFADGAALVAALDGAPFTPVPDARSGKTTAGTTAGLLLGDRDGDWRIGAEQVRERALARRDRYRARRRERDRDDPERPLPDRIRAFRRRFVSYAGTSVFLFGINAMTGGHGHHFWWAVFPVLGMGLGIAKSAGSLWADGVRLRDIFGGSAVLAGTAPSAQPAIADGPAAATDVPGVSSDVLSGPRGAAVRQAASDRRAVLEVLGRLKPEERALLPDVHATTEALYDRIVALASALHRLDDQFTAERVSGLDERIAQMERAGDGSNDRDRRLTLLKKQRQMLLDLARSRDTLVEQFESASLLLQNLALDMWKVRSSGLSTALDGVTSVTQEARALSREIGYVLDAAEELRALEKTSSA